MRTTNRERIERYDTLVGICAKNELAVHDLVNGAFGKALRIDPALEIDPTWEGGHYTVYMSPRFMPLFLIVYKCKGQDDQASVWTDSEIQAKYSETPTNAYARLLMLGRNKLVHAHMNGREAV